MEQPRRRPIRDLLASGAGDVAAIVVFYATLWTLGLKAAIGATLMFLVIDAVRRHRLGLGFPRIYLLSGALTVGFGAIDLLAETPFMIKYEAVVSSMAVGALFAAGARGKSIIQEVVEQQNGTDFSLHPELPGFFRFLTLLWAGYFIVKAAVYLWLGEIVPMERLLEIRPFIGFGSLALMMLVSWRSQFLFAFYRRLARRPAPPDHDVELQGHASPPKESAP